MEKQWIVASPDPKLIRHLCRRTGCHPVTAAVLANRGFDTDDGVSRFLNPSLQDINAYFSLTDMEKAVSRIAEAIGGNEKILIFGDYDVDGITATTLLYTFLKESGAWVDYYIPHRIEEGYGLRPEHIPNVAIPGNYQLIITTDCGSGSDVAVELASDAGIDVVITDHHAIENLPRASAVVNPKRPDCSSGLEHLAGVGVAFYLLICLRKHLRDIGYWDDRPEPNLKAASDLVALGTVADVVPLLDENRVFTKMGLEVINNSPRPGIKALIEISGVKKPVIEADDLAFRLAPRLNAAGRMDHAAIAVELLMTEDPEEARRLAETVNRLNLQRQSVESQIQRRIELYLAQIPDMDSKRSIILAHEDWHLGVLGIVASRMVDRYCRPVILFAMKDGLCVGSARSIAGVNLYENLCLCQHHLDAFGGHAMAAGLTIRQDRVESFRQTFEQCIRESTPDAAFAPRINIDCEIHFDMVTDQLVDDLSRLQPYGAQNPEPLFCAENVEVVYSRTFGERHRRFGLKQTWSKHRKTIEAVCFNTDISRPAPSRFEKLAFRLRRNHYNGRKDIQLIIEEMIAG